MTGNNRTKSLLNIILLILIFTSLSISSNAQIRRNSYRRTGYCPNIEYKVFGGIKVGANLTYFKYSDPEINDLYSSNILNPMPLIGGFFEFKIWDIINLGTTIEYKSFGTIINPNGLVEKYKYTAHNIDFALPIYFDIPATKLFNPYILVQPEMSYTMGGKIYLKDIFDEYTAKVGNANITRLNCAVKCGVGGKFIFWSGQRQSYLRVDVGYNLGLSDTFSKMEINESSEALNLNLYEINGTRKSRGLEVCLSYAVSIK
ncbi:MAG: outer membrane beta-barrel protein [Bacteroidales bacterium]|jgi:hypothetical protein|nr:outer membrane beta-barrel protein [Bacteroidales bacterium]MDD2205335.1 outer membrane beta-barrel protein [Bacteroidales bacterium]MDD3152059.1 outer membrane beta-barrel protein [Bacteroidales bacterium]MDD3914124.1 outer membrane beta-barrel protein [Bacteroidales bacterium]MDD4634076.1 outer membrane beta-barrel protein [Bacteroidales bacterium]